MLTGGSLLFVCLSLCLLGTISSETAEQI